MYFHFILLYREFFKNLKLWSNTRLLKNNYNKAPLDAHYQSMTFCPNLKKLLFLPLLSTYYFFIEIVFLLTRCSLPKYDVWLCLWAGWHGGRDGNNSHNIEILIHKRYIYILSHQNFSPPLRTEDPGCIGGI